MPPRSRRFESLPEYPLALIPIRKRELLARGVDVIDLGAGDADLAPPAAAVQALADASRVPAMNRYGFGLGNPAYRDAISGWMERRFGVRFNPTTEIVPLLGSKEGLSHLALGYVDRGDVTIIPEPGYSPYTGGTLLSDGEPYKVALRPENDFLVDLDAIPADVLRRARLLYLNYPNNPTAAIAPPDYLSRVVARCRELDLLLVYDNAYSEMGFDGYVPPSIFETDGARDVAIEFHSLSKTYNMTGWRCGWACGRPDVMATLAKIKSYVDTGHFMAVQQAGAAAIGSWADFVPGNTAVFQARRDAAVEAFRAAGFACAVPQATMYLWIPLPEGIPSERFAERLLEDEGVVVMPGTGFGPGGEGFYRISFITTPDRLREAAVRAGRVLASFAAPVA
ncbi:MAG: aminotransferase class I/II-fold pyridoxal phosphate-dependent enzyme [Gemmatimonadaceae bacterium]|nr:aminotransferase class I/II-fold pyridoxal phosphate-dependent enzyme [Gemmatimonadaceae bacterium]